MPGSRLGRRAAGGPHARRRGAARAGVRAGHAPHERGVVRARRRRGRGAQAREPAPADRLRRGARGRRARARARRVRRRSSSSPATSSTSRIQEIAQGRRSPSVAGLSYRANGHFERTPERAPLENMDALPFVVDVYHRDLVIEQYFIGYLLHPYVSLYTGRGCRSKCTFCLWPQTVGGHRYRTRVGRARRRRDRPGHAPLPEGEGVLLRRRHLHRRSAACRGDRARARAARRHVVVQREGERARRRRSRCCATTGCGSCWSATSPAARRS